MVINVQNKILHNLLPILNTLPNGVIPAARHSKTKKFFICFAMPSLALLCFAKLGFGSEVKMKVFGLSFCTSLALHYFASRS